jgi:hypothetical protein
MALNTSGIISLAGATTGQSIAVELALGTTTQISLNDTVVRTLAGLAGGNISLSNFWGKSSFTFTQRAFFGFGFTGSSASSTSVINLVSSIGEVASDTATVATGRYGGGGSSYGGDKAIIGFGRSAVSTSTVLINLVSNTGVVASNTVSVGSAKRESSASRYGMDKAIFTVGVFVNLVSNTGVMASDTTTTAVTSTNTRRFGASYGMDKAIIPYGSSALAIANLVSNTGVIAESTACVGTPRYDYGIASYGEDKAIIGFGNRAVLPTYYPISFNSLISNMGVIATETNFVGTTRSAVAASNYGGDKAIFGYGTNVATRLSMSNLVSNTGVMTADRAGVGSARMSLVSAGFSLT